MRTHVNRQLRRLVRPSLAMVAAGGLIAAGTTSVRTRAAGTGPIPVSTQIVHVAPGPPLPVPGSHGRPIVWISERSPFSRFGGMTYPFDFHFAERVNGLNFKPGERVAIAVRNVSAAPVVTTASSAGTFSAVLAFTWVYCGPNSVRSAPPIVTIQGNNGSSAQVSEYPAPCPALVALMAPALRNSQRPVSGFGSPLKLDYTVQGFGFAPGERVTLAGLNFGRFAPPTPVQISAGALGTFQVTLRLSLPGPCGAGYPPAQLVARGDRGTVVVARLYWLQPELACPVSVRPRIPGPASSHPGPAVAPSGNQVLAVGVQPFTAARAGWVLIEIQGPGSGTVKLSVRYQGGRTSSRTAALGADGFKQVRWRIPATARPGRSYLSVVSEPGHVSLSTWFMVH